mgnify:CR=1 FL=1
MDVLIADIYLPPRARALITCSYATFRKFFWWWSVNHSARPSQAPQQRQHQQQSGGSKRGPVLGWGKIHSVVMDSGGAPQPEALEVRTAAEDGSGSGRPGGNAGGRSSSGLGMQHRRKGVLS